MTIEDLRPILMRYRQQVQQAWSPATAHAEFPSKPGSPDGQCAVTSAWLQRRLAEDHGIQSTFCEGAATCRDEELDHCWLEVGQGWSKVIVDLTADQMEGLRDRPVVCSFIGDLCSESLRYTYKRSLTAEELAADPLQTRLAILQEAVGS